MDTIEALLSVSILMNLIGAAAAFRAVYLLRKAAGALESLNAQR